MSNNLKSFLICLVVIVVGDIIGAWLGFAPFSVAYGFTLGMIWSFLFDVFTTSSESSSQIQIIKDGNTIHIQSGGDITLRSEIVDR